MGSDDDEKKPYIFVRDTEYGWIPAEVSEVHYTDENDVRKRKKKAITVRTLKPYNWDESTQFEESDAYPFEENQNLWINTTLPANAKLPSQNVDDQGHILQAADLADLGFVNEASILYSLKERNYSLKPYSKVNGILVSLNPFKRIDGLYADKKREEYANNLIFENTIDFDAEKEKDLVGRGSFAGESLALADGTSIEPHIFQISCLAYKGLISTPLDQSILVSGESGSGKTYAVKLLMEDLAAYYSMTQSSETSDKSSGQAVASRVLKANEILEAFGNAQTIRNENSSRFSKFVKLQFKSDGQYMALIGSSATAYVLEKSRILNSNSRERNYHIFYRLLAADNQFKRSIWEGLVDTDKNSFQYIGAHGKPEVDDKPDSDHLQDTIDAMTTMGLSDEQRRTIFRAVCIVLQIGNINFEEDPSDSSKSKINSPAELIKLSDIMEIPIQEIESCLTSRLVKARNETFTVHLKVSDARQSRDTLAKSIYSSIFDYMVGMLNDATEDKSKPSGEERAPVINLLDIFGFESYPTCLFEQLCINYANEKIQAKYTEDNFNIVLNEFRDEKIDILEIPGIGEPEVLALLERRSGLITILNDKCIQASSTAKNFVYQLKQLNVNNPCLIQNKLARPTEFGIKHYAATLTYDAELFIPRNKEAISDELMKCAINCSNEVVSTQSKKTLGGGDGAKVSRRGKSSIAASFVLGKFQRQLKTLMKIIEQTKTYYVRCIKPNTRHVPKITDHKTTLDQLTTAGLVEALNISQNYFQSSYVHSKAIERFQALTEPRILRGSDDKDCAERLFGMLLSQFVVTDSAIDDSRSHAVGLTKIYFRGGSLEYLEAKRKVVQTDAIIILQRFFRKVIKRIRFLAFKKAALMVQAFERKRKTRMLYLKKVKICRRIQCLYRGYLGRNVVYQLKRHNAAVRIQTCYRGKSVGAEVVLILKAAKKIFAFVKKRLSKEKFSSLMANVVEDARKDTQMKKVLLILQDEINAEKAGNRNSHEALLQECKDLLSFSREKTFQLRDNNSRLKIDKSTLSAEHTRLQQKYISAQSACIVMQGDISTINEANTALMRNLGRQRKLLSTKSRDLRENVARTDALSDEFEKEREMIELSNKEEIEKYKKEMDLMKIFYEKELQKTKDQAELDKNRLQKEITTLEDEMFAEEESNSISFQAMMAAIDGRNKGITDSFGSIQTPMGDIDEASVSEL
mmetsp:Transcript_22112/g.44341  ORF Transcript_22112/g.44341 Transcript_22112/m.44341 type:complete len:1202 (-) Transcript_22112:127-3732(-)|eukprot:CAMPEP_0194325012 /NCGR_PEP_ID=MMETSP0171-20130528/28984_1 /TAXON_ID=218684 /ORGANISM="Corethron pennatum, Strain L29A3" /LENGTH=1201 /DNA_ID=CAMNT_0039084019 /DNA_START=75 /DNA_END=3680 /DNA_ORIENTATION=-